MQATITTLLLFECSWYQLQYFVVLFEAHPSEQQMKNDRQLKNWRQNLGQDHYDKCYKKWIASKYVYLTATLQGGDVAYSTIARFHLLRHWNKRISTILGKASLQKPAGVIQSFHLDHNLYDLFVQIANCCYAVIKLWKK